LFFVLALGGAVAAGAAPSRDGVPATAQPSHPAPVKRVMASSEFPALVGSRVELHGVAGLGKNGAYILVDGEGVDFQAEGFPFRTADDFGTPMVASGVLRHTGPITPPPGCEVDAPCQGAMENYFLEDASARFVKEPPPDLASQAGKWVLIRGTLDVGKAGPLIVTEVGPVYLDDASDPVLKNQAGARVYASGRLERVSVPSQADGDDQVAQVSEHYVIRGRQIRFVDRRPLLP
jgi:hypothetical protein